MAHETLQDFVLAATERAHDGLALLLDGQFHGGVYLLGYGAEVWLKVGYFKLRGLGPTDFVTLEIAKSDAEANGWAQKKTNGHDLDWWRKGIEHQRSSKRLASLDPQWGGVVATLGPLWDVEMRYRASARTSVDARLAYECVAWIEKRHADLWS